MTDGFVESRTDEGRHYVEFTQNLTRGIDASKELHVLLGRLQRDIKEQLKVIELNRNVVPVESEELCEELDRSVAELLRQLGEISEIVKRTAKQRTHLAAAWKAYLGGLTPTIGDKRGRI